MLHKNKLARAWAVSFLHLLVNLQSEGGLCYQCFIRILRDHPGKKFQSLKDNHSQISLRFYILIFFFLSIYFDFAFLFISILGILGSNIRTMYI